MIPNRPSGSGNLTNILLAVGGSILFVIGWMYVTNLIWPPKPPVVKPTQEMVALVGGGSLTGLEAVGKLKRTGKIEETPTEEVAKKDPEPKKEADPKEQPFDSFELIPLGHGDRPFFLQVLLNTRGAAVQQVLLTEFPEADREGLEVRDAQGKPVPLPLVPGTRFDRKPSLRAQRGHYYPKISPGKVSDWDSARILSFPSYVMYHYDKPSDDNPLDTLGEKNWDYEVNNDPDSDVQWVIFKTTLRTLNHQLEIRKTFTLSRRDYHLGMKIEILPLEPGKKSELFRYQVTGAHGLPIEGEWYTSTYRQAIIGFQDMTNTASRYLEDSREIRHKEGSDRIRRDEKKFIRFAAVAVQYFASVLAVDNEQVAGQKQDFLEFVRATPVGKTNKDKPFLDDITVRAISEPIDVSQATTHQYLLYHGPIKVRLLRQLARDVDLAVDDALVERYLEQLHLGILTDAPMNNAFGRFLNSIWWSDLVIAFTNLIHSLLYVLSKLTPNLGVCILVITLIVRLMLFPLSRRQAYSSQVMQAQMAKLAPEIRKIQEKYKGDFNRMNQERMRLYREHGVNPFGAMGGCFLLLLQMPIMMGLYFALQESIFFRLETFLWMPNLAAPDMLLFWSESIPFISTPQDLGDMTYLGPYLNVLPILAVGLMMYQQAKMMPPSDDPQVQTQQRMMKIMMVFMGIVFYKMAAGMCIYFIASTALGLLERKFTPKYDPEADAARKAAREQAKAEAATQPPGFFGRIRQRWSEKWKEILEQAQKQAEYQREKDRGEQQQPGKPIDQRAAGGKKKKKKR